MTKRLKNQPTYLGLLTDSLNKYSHKIYFHLALHLHRQQRDLLIPSQFLLQNLVGKLANFKAFDNNMLDFLLIRVLDTATF